ncbi:MAG: 30S ribosomal protein S16 [Candidatus Vogelbacteria bacterium]|nr:30S ribosomal protein S16 [Candidatus Vogelbacteria bacterium]
MLKIRLQRVGRKNDPSFRLVVTESQHGPQSGKFLEVLGNYDARHGQPQFKAERIKHWLSVGAQASPTAHNLLVSGKVIEGKKVNALPKRKPVEKKPDAPVPTAKAVATPEEKVIIDNVEPTISS